MKTAWAPPVEKSGSSARWIGLSKSLSKASTAASAIEYIPTGEKVLCFRYIQQKRNRSVTLNKKYLVLKGANSNIMRFLGVLKTFRPALGRI